MKRGQESSIMVCHCVLAEDQQADDGNGHHPMQDDGRFCIVGIYGLKQRSVFPSSRLPRVRECDSDTGASLRELAASSPEQFHPEQY